jgi:5-methylcytosine-specific restriction protein B
MNTTWVPFFTELAKRLLDYEDRQLELIAILRSAREAGIPVYGLVDHDGDLSTIDPFTFIASVHRGMTLENRLALCARIGDELGIKAAVPSAFDGVPTMSLQNSWFFAYSDKRRSLSPRLCGATC